MPMTQELAEFAASCNTLPSAVKQMARLCLTDWFGATLGASTQEIAAPLRRTITRLDRTPQSSIVGSSLRVSCANAALINGTLSHALELDDVHLKSAVHGSAPVWAAVLALGEFTRATPQEMTAAFAVGYEVMARVGLPIGQRMISRNHHPTGILGYFGAAAAAGRILKLNAREQAHAFGIAGGQAGACTQVRGTMSKPFFAGHSAHGGVLSALLALDGFTSATDIFEGDQGILATYAPEADRSPVLEGLGTRWEVEQNAFKVHASCAMSHALVDGLLALRESHGIAPADVEAISLTLYPHCTEYLDKPVLANGLAGKFSAQFCAAIALVDGVVQEGQFSDARAADPQVVRLMASVRMVPDARYAMDQAHVSVHLRNGAVVSQEVLAVQGSPARPLAEGALDAKFLALASRALPEARAAAVLQMLHAWPDCSFGALIGLVTTELPHTEEEPC